MIRVFLVDDQALVRSGFAMLLSAQADITVVGEAADGAAALRALAGVEADVVLMDIRMPVMDGVAATRELLARPGAPRVLVLTTFDLDEYVFAALNAGASGFLLKDARPDELLGALRAVADGDAVIAPSATRRLLEHVAPTLSSGSREPDPALRLLTVREREVLVQVARGLTNAEIAVALYMAESTVKTHIGSLLAKLGRRDRVALVLLAFRAGLVAQT
ncbi:DNA-binding response regulator, NarL/FixJ family, contains REC and HTH domains [Nakamurella panacisegetis]|uniref:DNA-binding response regulator, NarL/FixJ family, contains REC and HTH domains n=1 Tax=Nakamurella panacisegetis TaxID=1090615 RepID=A0A1H0LY42_9ACTN|nr:response regulator transcription factor [Nakamurella panacisegetis]SDO72840.1 DNA-binding response regulator, NarL/FixJ family, contains REC and HTH domains [Nakamurella panacisegetis]